MKDKIRNNYRVLGCDPGRVNFAWAIYSDQGLEGHGLLEGADALDRLDANAAQFERLLKFEHPDACCVERFQQRPGKGAGRNLELVNLMIGQIRMICQLYRIPCKLVTAAEHKRWIAQNFKVELSKKKSNKTGVSKKYDITTYLEWRGLKTEHEVDAANIAKYAHSHAMRAQRPAK